MKQIKKITFFDMDRKLTRNEMSKVLAGTVHPPVGGGSGSCNANKECASGCDDGTYCSDCGTCTKP